MAVVSAGTYYGLELLPPGTIPEPIGRSAAAAAHAEPPKPAETQVAAAPAQEPAAAPAPAEAPVTEQDLAEEPPPEETPAEPAQVAAAEPAPAQPVAEPAPPPAQKPAPAAEPAAQPSRAPALQDVIDEPAPKPKAKPRAAAPAAAAEPSSEGTQVASAAEPSAPKQPKAAPPESDVIKPWWPDSTKMPANQLKLQYAGQVQGEQAIALLFSAPLKLDSVQANTKVKTLAGEDVKGSWELGKNPRLAVFRGVGSGRYTVILQPQVADTKGFMLGTTLQGPVYIQAP